MGRKKEIFSPLNKGEVTLYTCGPTIYNYAHIGNYRTYVQQDVLRRYLEFLGYKVKQVMNLTDVDDKTIRDSQKADKDLKAFTDFYAKAFFEDIKILNIEPAFAYPRATAYINEIVEFIKKLAEKGYAYRGEDGSVYFAVSKFKDYGKFAGIKIGELKAGARVKQDEYSKEEAKDFALWKAWDENDGNVFWNTEIGKGRPGWHIECSVMAINNLGETIDIHSGGEDLIFPHHQNEIAQSEAETGKPFARYWVHTGWLMVNGQKMSKSLGNFYTLRDILKKGYNPKAIRYMFISTHYKSQFNFTEEELKNSETTVDRMLEFMEKIQSLNPESKELNDKLHDETNIARKDFIRWMDDDLNTPQALAVIFEYMTNVNKAIADKQVSKKNLDEAHKLMMEFDKVLGILAVEKEPVPAEIEKLLAEREQARQGKDFKKSDLIRAKIRRHGWEVQDTPEGQKARKPIS
jgi:cysteinyl-tRNA synthetase